MSQESTDLYTYMRIVQQCVCSFYVAPCWSLNNFKITGQTSPQDGQNQHQNSKENKSQKYSIPSNRQLKNDVSPCNWRLRNAYNILELFRTTSEIQQVYSTLGMVPLQ